MEKVQRPWGWYQIIDQGDCYKTKNIEVDPGESLSLPVSYTHLTLPTKRIV